MNIVNPLPVYCIVLLPLLYIGYLFSYRLSQLIVTDNLTRRIIAIVIFCSLWLYIIIYTGLFCHSFIISLFTGTAVLFISGLLTELFYLHKITRPAETKNIFNDKNSHKWMWITASISTVVIYFIAANGNFHDEILINGHKAIIAQLLNDFFPPRNQLYPEDALRYHYGFDIICAAFIAITRCGNDFAIDFVTAASWFYCWVGLWILGEKLFTFKRAGMCVAICTMLGGGLGPLLGSIFSKLTWDIRLIGGFQMHTNLSINPPLISYIFQHPFAAGLPVAICILLIITDNSVKEKYIKDILLIILFAALYFCQTVLFITLLPVFTLFYIYYKRQFRIIIYSAVIILILIISRSGLFFTPLKTNIGSQLDFRFWPMHASVEGIGGWYIGSFGLLLLFSIIGFIKLKRVKPLLAIITVVSLFIPVFFTYRYTWDIVKFSTVAAFYMGILSGGGIAWMLQSDSGIIRKIAMTGIVMITGSAFIFVGVFIYKEKFGKDYYYQKYVPQIPEGFSASVNWMRKYVKQNEMVLCPQNYMLPFAIYSGLPTVFDDGEKATAFGLPEDRRIRISEMLSQKSIDINDFYRFNINWVIEDDADSLCISDLLASSGFDELKKFGKLKIFRLCK